MVLAGFLLAARGWRTWFSSRQMRCVAKHRATVPADFAAFIPLEAHRKAADYTLDKQRLGLVETLTVDGVLLFALTLGGGPAAIDALARDWFGEGYVRHLATVFRLMALTTPVALPFDIGR